MAPIKNNTIVQKYRIFFRRAAIAPTISVAVQTMRKIYPLLAFVMPRRGSRNCDTKR